MTSRPRPVNAAAQQLELTLRASPARPAVPPAPARERARAEAEFLERLRAHGLTRIERCRLTRNRTVMVSYRGTDLRVHEGFAAAPPEVLRAIAAFVTGRGAARRAAQRVIMAFPVERRPPRRVLASHSADERFVAELRVRHAEFNGRHFGGALGPVDLRVSRRMQSRLGHYRVPAAAGERGEIVISRRHIRRHAWSEVLDTLLHEMVHQWQHEQGLAVDHGPAFRRKAREVGIVPAAKRPQSGVLGRLAARIFDACDIS